MGRRFHSWAAVPCAHPGDPELSTLVSVVQRWLFHLSPVWEREQLLYLPGQTGHMQGLQAVLIPWGFIRVGCRGQRSDPKGLISSLSSLGESLSLAQGCANSNRAAKGSGKHYF